MVAKGDSNPGSLDCKYGVLPLSYRAPQIAQDNRLDLADWDGWPDVWCYKDGHWTEQGIKKLEARDNESGRNVPESLEKKVEVVRAMPWERMKNLWGKEWWGLIDWLFIREYINNMRPTGATRGRINCGSTILITVNKSTNKTNYKRPQWCCAKTTPLRMWSGEGEEDRSWAVKNFKCGLEGGGLSGDEMQKKHFANSRQQRLSANIHARPQTLIITNLHFC